MKIFIYPSYNPIKDKSGNSYIKDFFYAFSKYYIVLNNKSNFGTASVFFNLSADVFIFHWTDLIGKKRFAPIQSLLFILSLIILRIMSKKIVWVMHNKEPHKGKSLLSSLCMYFSALFSNLVVVHASEGINYFVTKYSKLNHRKIIYIPHPVYEIKINLRKFDFEWDYIVWGGISPHKGIIEFLAFVQNNQFMKSKKILICGICSDKDYHDKILALLSTNIIYRNEFIDNNKLEEYIFKSKCILFTYLPTSVLSSGAVVQSLGYRKKIIGPNFGAFHDLRKIISVYDCLEDIPNIDIESSTDQSLMEEYFNENTWENLPGKIMKELTNE